jgi:hypothetical protein
MKNEIILYKPNEAAEHIEVRLEDETVWLTQVKWHRCLGKPNRISVYT